jgi:hypothetical protein
MVQAWTKKLHQKMYQPEGKPVRIFWGAIFCEGSAGTFARHRKYFLRDAYKPLIPLHNQHLCGIISSSSTRTVHAFCKSRPVVDLLSRIFDIQWLKYMQPFTWFVVGLLGSEFMVHPNLRATSIHETEGPWPLHLKICHWSTRARPSKFASH